MYIHIHATKFVYYKHFFPVVIMTMNYYYCFTQTFVFISPHMASLGTRLIALKSHFKMLIPHDHLLQMSSEGLLCYEGEAKS